MAGDLVHAALLEKIEAYLSVDEIRMKLGHSSLSSGHTHALLDKYCVVCGTEPTTAAYAAYFALLDAAIDDFLEGKS